MADLARFMKPKEDFHRPVEVNRKFRNGDYRDRIPADILFDTQLRQPEVA